MTASRGSNAGNYGSNSAGSARTAGFGRTGANGGYDSNRPPSAQRGFDGRTTAGNFGSNRPTSSGATLGRVGAGSNAANRPNGGRTMTTSYAPAMHDGSSVGRGNQRVGSEGFQADRPPSSRTTPERSSTNANSGMSNRGATNEAFAGGNRASMNGGASHFGNAGISGRRTSGGALLAAQAAADSDAGIRSRADRLAEVDRGSAAAGRDSAAAQDSDGQDSRMRA